MSFVVLHKRAGGSEAVEDVAAIQLDAVNCDKLRHNGLAPLLIEGQTTWVWAAEGKEVGQFSEAPVPVGYDTVTGQPIFTVDKLKPTGFDPVTGQPVFPKPINQPAPVAVPAANPVG